MKNLVLFTFLAFTILGLLSPNMSELFADKGGNGKSQGEPKGCDNNKGKDAIKNPNCSDSTPNTVNCTYGEDNEITTQDLMDALDITESRAQSIITTAENANPDENDQMVNNELEFVALNNFLLSLLLPTCT